jgi:DNA-directed RNA polymerase specialized sigma24 family protein
LRLHHGMTNQEISTILNLSVQRVKNYVYETTKELREQIFKNSIKENF